MSQPKKLEDYAYVLDFLPFGYPAEARKVGWKGPIAQVIGEAYLTLLEVTVYPHITLQPREKVYIGKGERNKVDHVERRISYDELTPVAQDELPIVLEIIIDQNPERFLEFFNTAGPVTTRMHALELLPGIGKKGMWRVLEERKKAPFKSFDDLQQRTHIPDPKKALIKRIISEIKGEDKYYLFVKPPYTAVK